MSSRPAIVTTLKHPSPSVLEFFVKYHQAIGFEHLFLFFDDPDDPALDQARAYPGVTAIANDELLKSIWADSPQYAWHKNLLGVTEARQILNCNVAVELSLESGYDWLLHIDIDELFYSPRCSAREHFDALDARGVDNIIYMNFEVVPESEDVDNYFAEATLFKKNPYLEGRTRFDEQQEQLVRGLTDRYGLIPYHGYFVRYTYGKSAARTTPDLGLKPLGLGCVHRFVHWSDPGREPTIAGDDQLILHYPCCSFGRFWGQYQPKFPIFLFRRAVFHDVAQLWRRDDVEGARRLYRDVFMLRDQVESLLAAGILCRIEEPARMWRRIRGLTGTEVAGPSDMRPGRVSPRSLSTRAAGLPSSS